MRAGALFQRLQAVDRRLVYLVVLVVLGIPFLVDFSLPIFPDRYSTRTFQAIDAITRDPVQREKVVLIVSNWGPPSEGENGPQLQYVIQHLLRRGVRFLLCSTGDPMAWAVAEARLEMALRAERRLAFERGEKLPEFVYGEHYLKLGFNFSTVFEPIARSLVLNTREFFRTDVVEHKPLTDENFPLLRRLRGVEDIALVYVVTAGDEARSICGIVQRQVPGLKVATGTMGISANDLYPYMRSGNLCGLLNSARGAAEYMSLLDPDAPVTAPVENSMSLGKLLLLALVVLGNVAFLLTRRAERAGRLAPLPTHSQPMPDLPRWALGGLLGLLLAGYAAAVGLELWRDLRTGTVPRHRVARATDDPARDYPDFERVDPASLAEEARAQLAPDEAARATARARAEFARLIELRIGEFVAALLTLGIFAFLLGENPFYRVTESIMVGGGLAFFLLDTWDKMLRPRWFQPIVSALDDGGNRWDLLWLVMLLPGALWYFVYSRRYRWLNQLVVALFLGAVVGAKLGEQIGLLVPQIVDSIQPVWPFVRDAAPALPFAPGVQVQWQRLEHLVFVIVMVLSLSYFIFFLRPKTPLARGVITASRLIMMVGFGAMFGNTVNTRLSWLAPRVGYLLDDWLGKLLGS